MAGSHSCQGASSEPATGPLRVYSSRNSLWRPIQWKTALPRIPASLQMARRLLPSASRAVTVSL